MYNYIKKKFSPHNYKKKFLSDKYKNGNPMLNLSLNELRLIAEHRNISDYENKSAKDLIKALRRSKLKLGIKKKELKEIKEDLYNLRHDFSKRDADKYRKLFYDIKNFRHLSEQEIKEIRKTFNKLEKTLNFKKPRNNVNSIHYEDLDKEKTLMVKMLIMINIEKLELLEDYLKSLIEIFINQQ